MIPSILSVISKVCLCEGFSEDCPVVVLEIRAEQDHNGAVWRERCSGVDLGPQTTLLGRRSWPCRSGQHFTCALILTLFGPLLEESRVNQRSVPGSIQGQRQEESRKWRLCVPRGQ